MQWFGGSLGVCRFGLGFNFQDLWLSSVLLPGFVTAITKLYGLFPFCTVDLVDLVMVFFGGTWRDAIRGLECHHSRPLHRLVITFQTNFQTPNFCANATSINVRFPFSLIYCIQHVKWNAQCFWWMSQECSVIESERLFTEASAPEEAVGNLLGPFCVQSSQTQTFNNALQIQCIKLQCAHPSLT
jgi:hypothetical protein